MVEQTIRQQQQQQERQPLSSSPLIATVNNNTNETFSIMCSATAAVEKLIPFPEREYKRMRYLIDDDYDDENIIEKPSGAFDMSALARVSIPIKESLSFPLIEWSINDTVTDETMSSSWSKENESLSRARLFLDTVLLTASPTTASSSNDGRLHRMSPSSSSSIHSDKQRERPILTSTMSTSTSTCLAIQKHRRRLVRSIALDSRLALLDPSARPIERCSSTESTTSSSTNGDDHNKNSCFTASVSISTTTTFTHSNNNNSCDGIAMSFSQQDLSCLRFPPSPPPQTR